MFSKKTLSVLAVSALLSVSAWADSQQDQGHMGIPDIGTDAKTGKKIVPKTLDDIPAKYCPADNPLGWQPADLLGIRHEKVQTGSKGWACSQLHLSGNNLYSLFDKSYRRDTAAGAKYLAPDAMRAKQEALVNQGVEHDAAWGQVNKLVEQFFGAGYTFPPQQESYKAGGYSNYDDPFYAIMFDSLNRCGCVVTLNETTNTDVATGETLPNNSSVENGCPGAAATMCAEQAERIKTGHWGTSHQYNKTFQELANVCIYFWNSLVNNSYNQKNHNTTDPNDAAYQQVCDTGSKGVEPCCEVAETVGKFSAGNKLSCDGFSFIGPGSISYTGEVNGKTETQAFTYEDGTWRDGTAGKVCKAPGKIDIVAQ